LGVLSSGPTLLTLYIGRKFLEVDDGLRTVLMLAKDAKVGDRDPRFSNMLGN